MTATPRVSEHRLGAERNGYIALYTRARCGSVTSTQIEAVATVADESGSQEVELTPHGDLLLYNIRPRDAVRITAALAEAGLAVADTPGGPVSGERPLAQPGLQHIELAVPRGRVTGRQLRDLARLARTYADCELRLTDTRTIVIVNMPRANLPLLLREPLLRDLRPTGD